MPEVEPRRSSRPMTVISSDLLAGSDGLSFKSGHQCCVSQANLPPLQRTKLSS